MTTAEAVKPQKIVNDQNQIWHFTEKGLTFIGFTESFLEVVRDCWHVTPASRTDATENSPLLSIETDDALFAVSSPVSGSIIGFDNMAMNFPDKLTAESVVVTIGEKKAKKPKSPNTGRIEGGSGMVAPQLNTWGAEFAAQPIRARPEFQRVDDLRLEPFQAPTPSPITRRMDVNVDAARMWEEMRRDHMRMEAQLDAARRQRVTPPPPPQGAGANTLQFFNTPLAAPEPAAPVVTSRFILDDEPEF